MIVYLVVWDIASYDGDALLSIWSSKEKAEQEVERLRKKDKDKYGDDYRDDEWKIIPVTVDTPEFDDNVVVS